MKKMTGRFLLSIFLLSLVLSACSEPELTNDNDTIIELPEPGNWLCIDEYNQILNRVNTDSEAIDQMTYVGSAANDIEIDGDTAYVVASLNDTLFSLDLTSGTIRTLKLGYNVNPYNIAIDEDLLYITLSVENALAVVTRSNLTISKMMTNPDYNFIGNPQGVDCDASSIYVATSVGYLGGPDADNFTNGQIIVIDKATYNIETNIPMNQNPQSVALDGNGKGYVACTGYYDTAVWQYAGDAALVEFDTATYATNPIDSDIHPIGAKVSSGRVYTSLADNGGLSVYGSGGTLLTNLLAGQNLKGLDFDSDSIYLQNGYTHGKKGESFIVDKADFSVSVISNTGGGDAALYR